MRDVTGAIDQWRAAGQPVAVATVVQTWGSSPRQAGAKMALTPGGDLAGSVSGGCVEGAVFEAGVAALKQNQGRLLHFGVADETAWEVGLACGGSIDVFVQPLAAGAYEAVKAALDRQAEFAVLTVVAGPQLGGQLVLDATGTRWSNLDAASAASAADLAQAALTAGQSQRQPWEGGEAFIEVVVPPPTLVAVGGVHITIALVALAKTLGYRTIVVDPRAAFGNDFRFPPGSVDRLIQEWPDEALAMIALTPGTAVAMLTHDPKLDDPALKIALPSAAFYVGALGSQTTQAKRRQRLLNDGLTEAQLDRLHGPIGLPLHAATPEEIALSVMAEIVKVKNEGK
ncbi:MAG: XdhC family protein [Anaerolineales bacterium]|nr:XdhC family protein [Anaerolineales bacterium]